VMCSLHHRANQTRKPHNYGSFVSHVYRNFYALEKAATRRAILCLRLASTWSLPLVLRVLHLLGRPFFLLVAKRPTCRKNARGNRAHDNWTNCPTVALVRALTETIYSSTNFPREILFSL